MFQFVPHNNTVPLSIQVSTVVYLLKFQLDQVESPSDIHRPVSALAPPIAGRGAGTHYVAGSGGSCNPGGGVVVGLLSTDIGNLKAQTYF